MATKTDYSLTATGILGTYRKSMLRNQILLRPPLGKPQKRGHSLPGPQFTYGICNSLAEGSVAEAISGWPMDKQTGQRRKRTPMSIPDYPYDTSYVETEIEDPKKQWKPRRIPSNMVFGIISRPPTPVFDLLEHRYQDKWIQEHRRELIARMLKERPPKKKSKSDKTYETRSSLLRTYQTPVDEAPLWQLPKFTRHSVPVLNTFRTEASRSAAYKHNQSDCVSRRGVLKYGVYDSAKN